MRPRQRRFAEAGRGHRPATGREDRAHDQRRLEADIGRSSRALTEHLPGRTAQPSAAIGAAAVDADEPLGGHHVRSTSIAWRTTPPARSSRVSASS